MLTMAGQKSVTIAFLRPTRGVRRAIYLCRISVRNSVFRRAHFWSYSQPCSSGHFMYEYSRRLLWSLPCAQQLATGQLEQH